MPSQFAYNRHIDPRNRSCVALAYGQPAAWPTPAEAPAISRASWTGRSTHLVDQVPAGLAAGFDPGQRVAWNPRMLIDFLPPPGSPTPPPRRPCPARTPPPRPQPHHPLPAAAPCAAAAPAGGHGQHGPVCPPDQRHIHTGGFLSPHTRLLHHRIPQRQPGRALHPANGQVHAVCATGAGGAALSTGLQAGGGGGRRLAIERAAASPPGAAVLLACPPTSLHPRPAGPTPRCCKLEWSGCERLAWQAAAIARSLLPGSPTARLAGAQSGPCCTAMVGRGGGGGAVVMVGPGGGWRGRGRGRRSSAAAGHQPGRAVQPRQGAAARGLAACSRRQQGVHPVRDPPALRRQCSGPGTDDLQMI
jgi:hypothetical protein